MSHNWEMKKKKAMNTIRSRILKRSAIIMTHAMVGLSIYQYTENVAMNQSCHSISVSVNNDTNAILMAPFPSTAY